MSDINDATIAKFEASLQGLREATKVQCSDGNWNYSSYMHGMANGMLFALSCFEGGNPEYLEAPTKWLKDEEAPPGTYYEEYQRYAESLPEESE